MLQVRLAPLSASVATIVPLAVEGPETGVVSSAARPVSVTPPATCEVAPITGASLVPVSFTVSVAMLSVPLARRMA